ncbi:MAG: hypothetical protein AAGA72_15105 [Pseudomonadota bacterium]
MTNIDISVHFLDEEEQREATQNPKVRKLLKANAKRTTFVENFFVNSIALVNLSLKDESYQFELHLTEWLKIYTIGLRIVKINRPFDLKLHMLVSGENFEISYRHGLVTFTVYDKDGSSLALRLSPDQSYYLHEQLRNYLFEMVEVCNVMNASLEDRADYYI